MRPLARFGLAVVLCLGQVALLGSGVVAHVPENDGPAHEDAKGSDSVASVGGSVPDGSSDAGRVAPACDQTYDNGTPGDSSDDYRLASQSVDSDGSRTCVYTRVVSRVVDADPVECAKTRPGGFTHDRDSSTAEKCVYKRVPYTTHDARKTVSYSCDPRSGWSLTRRGDRCVYSKTETVVKPVDPAVYECPPLATYGSGTLVGRTCTYTRSGSTTLPAKVTTKYRCPPAPPTFSLTDVDYNRGQCIYSRSGTTTRPATYVPMFGNVGPCPTAPATFTYSKRVGNTCHYTRSTTTRRTYESYDTYTCPPAPATYSPDGQSGSTCRYKRTTSATRSATLKTPAKCPSRFVRRGDNCYQEVTTTDTEAAKKATTYSCRLGTLVGIECRVPRIGDTSTLKVYGCPKAQPGETLTESGSGKNKTCTYTSAETITITKTPPTLTLTKPTGVTANGRSPSSYGTGQSSVEWSMVPNATEYTVIVDRDDGTSTDTHTWTGSATSTTVKRLSINTLYRVRVRAHKGGVRSNWSTSIYTYPTTIPAGHGSAIGAVPIRFFRPSKGYRYTLCTNMVPNDVPSRNPGMWRKIINDAAVTWSDSTNKMVTVSTAREGTCTGLDANLREPRNVVKLWILPAWMCWDVMTPML